MRLYDQNIWGNMKADQRIANRNDLICSLIEKFDPDFCTFQECNPISSRAPECDIAKKLFYAFDEAAPEAAQRNFTPVFYRRDRFDCLESGHVLFEGRNDKNSKSYTWALLREKSSGNCITVISTHFWWKYEGEEDDMWRRSNARQLAAFCDAHYAKHPYPILISGDLNSGTKSRQGPGGYDEMILLGMEDIRHLAEKTTDEYTHHEYPHMNEAGNYIEGGIPERTIDYAFFYRQRPAQIQQFRVVTEQDALDSSDHCPLVVDFQL